MDRPELSHPTLDRGRSYLHVAEALRHEIHKLDVGEGGRLPSEREFTQLLKISRPSLREALIVLELLGEIEIRVGSGIYLKRARKGSSDTPPAAHEPAAAYASGTAEMAATGSGAPGPDRIRSGSLAAAPGLPDTAPGSPDLTPNPDTIRPVPDAATLNPPAAALGQNAAALGQSPREVHQMRYFLESGVAAYAARFITRAQLKPLAAALAAMRRALGGRRRTGDRPLADADRRFHVALAAVTGNQLLIRTLEDLFDQRYSPVAGSMHRLFDNQEVWREAIREHQEVYDAVAARDPLQAQAAMQRHLTRAHARLMAMIG